MEGGVRSFPRMQTRAPAFVWERADAGAPAPANAA